MKTLVLANQKGGVGKSAVATLLTHHLAQHGHKVLAIDLDHQGNFSKPLIQSGRCTTAPVTADHLLTKPISRMPEAPFIVVPSDQALLLLERQPAMHTPFARHLRTFFQAMDQRFDVCIVDTNPNPDIRLVAALVSADCVLSPIQLNLEAMSGVGALLNHQRAGVRKIKALLNPKLKLLGLLPTMVEPTPFQKANFVQLIQQYHKLLIPVGTKPGEFARIPRRSAIAEAQADGLVLWEMKKTAARDAWCEIEPSIFRIAQLVLMPQAEHAAAA